MCNRPNKYDAIISLHPEWNYGFRIQFIRSCKFTTSTVLTYCNLFRKKKYETLKSVYRTIANTWTSVWFICSFMDTIILYIFFQTVLHK